MHLSRAPFGQKSELKEELLAISICTSGYGLEHLATPFKGKLLNSVFRTKPYQSSGLAGPTALRAAPPRRRLPGYADEHGNRSFETITRCCPQFESSSRSSRHRHWKQEMKNTSIVNYLNPNWLGTVSRQSVGSCPGSKGRAVLSDWAIGRIVRVEQCSQIGPSAG